VATLTIIAMDSARY